MEDKVKQRFFKKVNKTDSCWLWTASLITDGYGQLNIDGKTIRAHRLSWLIAGNIIPDDKPILRHKCRNRHCVNPEHLEVGTHADNEADKIRDGTDARGEKHPSVKLTEAKVLEIRARAKENQRQLAIEFGVSFNTINDIIHHRKWKHL